MDKRKEKIIEWLTFAFLIAFPFGQLLKVGIVSGIDVIAGAFLVFYLVTRQEVPSFHRFSKNFFWISLFSLAFSIALFGSFRAIYGGLYLLRLVAYYAMFVVLTNWKGRLFNPLIAVSIAVGVFGWLQYFLYPDLRALYAWGWDDHLYRLVGTFLDPTFTGIILVFGFLLAAASYLANREKKLLLVDLFLLVTIAFTYSRASYLALLAGTAVIFFLNNRLKALVLATLALAAVVFFLPKGVGEGEKLERVASIYAKFGNYAETIQIIQKSPIFGIGFNNLCLAKEVFLRDINTNSHACAGSDSSLLLVLATTGIVGLIVFLRLSYSVIKKAGRTSYGIAFLGCLAALFIHSLFANSLFYPWVMGYLAILGGEVYRK